MIRQSLLAVAAAVGLALSTAAAQTVTEKPAPKKPPYTAPPQTSAPQAEGTQTVDVSGCLVSGTSPGTFVLAAQQTPLSSAMSQRLGGAVPSPMYELFGDTRALQGMVGHRVEVKGPTPKRARKTEVNEQRHQSQAKGTSGRTPTVKTDAQEKVELRRLDVQTLQSIEGACR